jgi:hypothetical protein
MKRVIIIFCLLLMALAGFSQQKALNIPGIHQLVADSKSENALQKSARDKQAVTTANEQANRTMLARLKVKYRQLQDRFHTIGIIIDAANIGIQAGPMVDRIIQNQAGIYRIAAQQPLFIGIAYQTEQEFVSKSRALVNYLIGLSASIGAVNQMKASDRKILFDYVLFQLSAIQELSTALFNSMQYSQAIGLKRSLNPFQDYIDQDADIIGDIFQNAKYLKQ